MDTRLWWWFSRPFPKLLAVGVEAAVLVLAACVTPRAAPPPPASASHEEYLRQGVAALGKRDYALAIERLKQAVSLKPDDARGYNFLGVAYEQTHDAARARASFEKAIALDPSLVAAYNNLGSMYSLAGDYERAIPLFAKALELNPSMVAARYNIGGALLAVGRTEEATTNLLAAIKLDPNFLESGSTIIATTGSRAFRGPDVAFLYARLYASTGNVDKTVQFLTKAKEAGFRDWQRIVREKEFEPVRDDPRVRAFIPD
jgi:Flp pilus assembly protein TadD